MDRMVSRGRECLALTELDDSLGFVVAASSTRDMDVMGECWPFPMNTWTPESEMEVSETYEGLNMSFW